MLAGLLLALGPSGCADRDSVAVELHVHEPPASGGANLEIQAQVTGRPTGLRYKWFTVSGHCDPQESDSPTTVFLFAEGVPRDRVSVEVWRDGQRVASSEVDVKVDPERMRQALARIPEVQIEITTIPPAEPGGPDTRADIAGRVSGRIEPDDKVVIYAYAYDNWHIQPIAHAMHPIASDNTWSNWTHTGTSYAALVVRPDYEPRIRLDVLPRVGGDVLARTVVEGKR
jgi:hypothetical protein